MHPYTVVLTGEGIGPLVAGGKGSALDKLVGLNARVPATGVITTPAYQAFEEVPEIAALVLEMKTSPIPDPSEHLRHRKRIDEVFLSIPLPSTLAEAVDALGVEIGDSGLVAVRSSATAEDLESASFAGQYESYLNVAADGVHDAVRLVWASLWYPAPRTYRQFRQIPEHDLTMAVVMMRMLDPSEAGVLFTVDPGGSDDAVRLEVVQGLGEQLVSGETTPDAYVIERQNMTAEFGAISAPLADLATEALRLEEALNAPQDIEFAVHDGDLYLVQARPITTVVAESRTDDGFDFSCGDDTTYTTAGIAEMLPGVLSPLSWSINSWLLENGFRYLFDLLGGGADVLTHEHALIGRFRGRAALNLDAMSDAAGSIPGGSPEELQRQYFGEAVPSASNDDGNVASSSGASAAPPTKTAGAAQGIRVLRARRGAVEESEVVIQAVDNLMEDEPSLARMSDQELFAYWNRLLHLTQRVVAVEVAVAAMASAAYRSVEVFLTKHMSEAEASAAVQELTTIDGADRRSRIALALDDVTNRIRNDANLREGASEDWDRARANFEKTVPGSRVVVDFFEALRRAGSSSIFAGPTWDEVPNLAWLTIYTELDTVDDHPSERLRKTAAFDLGEKLAKTPKWRWTRFVTGQLMDVRRRFLRREAADAAELLQRREHTKAAVLILGGVVRRANQEIALRLVEANVLESIEDVEMLPVGEISVLVGGMGPTPEVIALRRRRNLEAIQAEPLPLVWEGDPPEASTAEVTGERFEGWSASPGRYEGRARVVDSPATSGLRRGEVLVATTTDASWAPLFMAAGAVIVEQGGPLSHAAIVARELGMPAVANVPGLIKRLRQEDEPPMLVVDGTNGVVVIHLDDSEEPTHEGVSVGAGLAPLREPDKRWDDTSSSMNVFVAGLVGAGALMSVLIGLTESISSTRGRERLKRQAAPTAAMMAQGTVHGYENVLQRTTGLRPRSHYLVASLVLFAASAALLATSLDSYLSKSTASVVAFALSTTGVATLASVGLISAVAAHRWPNVPTVVRSMAPGRPAREHSVWSAVSPNIRTFIFVMLGLVAVGGLLAVVTESWLLEIDEPLYLDWLEAREDANRWGPDWLNRLGQPLVIIPLAVAIGFATLKCRVVAIAWPAAVVIGGLANIILSWVIHRERPPFSAHVGEFTSYPGGHSIQLTLLMGMLPLAVHVVTGSRSAMRLTAVAAAALWFVAWADTVRTGGHWPIDQLAGLLIAVSLLAVVYSASQSADHHESCVDCAPRLTTR